MRKFNIGESVLISSYMWNADEGDIDLLIHAKIIDKVYKWVFTKYIVRFEHKGKERILKLSPCDIYKDNGEV